MYYWVWAEFKKKHFENFSVFLRVLRFPPVQTLAQRETSRENILDMTDRVIQYK